MVVHCQEGGRPCQAVAVYVGAGGGRYLVGLTNGTDWGVPKCRCREVLCDKGSGTSRLGADEEGQGRGHKALVLAGPAVAATSGRPCMCAQAAYLVRPTGREPLTADRQAAPDR